MVFSTYSELKLPSSNFASMILLRARELISAVKL